MLASSAGVVVLAPTANATTTVDNDSFVTMVSAGDYIGQGTDYIFTPAVGDSVGIQGTPAGDVTVSVSGDNSDEFTLDLAAPTGSSLSDGEYVDAERTPFRSAGHPGIDISGDGRGCDTVAGRFDVLDIGTAGDGTVDRLDLTYVEYCEGGQATPLFGQISINEPAQDPDLMVAPTAVDWPDTFDGVSARIVPVRLINTGATSTTVSSLGATGDTTSFSIKSDGCTGKALAVGAACVADVGFTPSSPTPAAATLTAHDNTTLGHQEVSLSGAGIGGYTTWTLASDSGDYVGGGKSHAWTPLNSTITASGNNTGISTSVVAGANNFTAQFDPGNSQVLVPGTTYSNATRAGVGGSGPTLDVSGNGAGCNTIAGQFTVQQADFDPISGALEDFALTFVQHCEGAAPALSGSLSYEAPDPPAAVPSSTYTPPPPPATKLGAVTGLTAHGLTSGIALSWRNPTSSAWARSEVRILPGDKAPKTRTAGYLVYEGQVPATVIDGVDPGADYSLSVFPLTSTGRAGPRKSVTMHGTNLILSAPGHATHKRVTITVTLRAATHGTPLGKRQIALYGRRKGQHGAYGLITTLITKAGSGRAKVMFTLKKSVDVIARFNGKSTYIGSAAGPLQILL